MANVHVSQHPLVKHKVTQLRDRATGSKQFRELVDEITTLLLYEATQDLPVCETEVETPLTRTVGARLEYNLGFVPILRAGLGMVPAALGLLPLAQVWHLGLYREHDTRMPVEYYNKLPRDLDIDVALVLDPMLATGGSAVAAVDVLKLRQLKAVKFVGLIAAPEGVEALSSAHPDVSIHVAAVDSHLNDQAYIVPGLGDAGDRLFGTS
ncbi:MAG: uracil phosphoribosyltransferase [Chloroflexota bacterium]|nr:uracil phosphoribosyltransferase [Chloroflexota bacterium]